MANKPSPNNLIHCDQCGEDYSPTYKRCPFCGAKNTPQQASGRSGSDLDDTYVFDGQDLFDEDGEEDSAANSRGGKRLAEKPLPNPFSSGDINWPRVITFICSLVIIVAAMIIVFTVIFPLTQDPLVESQNPSSTDTGPGSSATQTVNPSAGVTGTTSPSGPAVTNPGTVPPTTSVPPTSSTGSGLRGFTTNTSTRDSTFKDTQDGFLLQEGESWQMRLTFDPVTWSGEVTYSVSDTRYATVTSSGYVTNVNPDSALHTVYLTIKAGGLTLIMPVWCRGATTPASQPPASDAPTNNPDASDPPVSPSPSGSTVTVGKKGVIVGAPSGVFVRSSPSNASSDNWIDSLFNGDEVTVLADAGNGWYKISYYGVGGVKEGYMIGICISTD